MKKIGQIFVDLGMVTDEQLELLVEEQEQSKSSLLLGEVAIELGYIDSDQLVEALCEQFGLQSIELSGTSPKQDLDVVPVSMIMLYQIVPLHFQDGVLTIATHSPQKIHIKDEIRQLLDVEVRLIVSSKKELNDFIAKHYDENTESFESIINELHNDTELNNSAKSLMTNDKVNLNDVEQLSNSKPIRRLLSMVLLEAIKSRASDIHFEPFEDEFKIRINSEGVLHELVPPPRHFASPIITRIKVMANLNISERRLPQDGKIGLEVGGHTVDIRVSVMPTIFGESVVCRLLDKSTVSLDLEEVGMNANMLSSFRSLIKKPNGIVLVTGPTGSGKTTTLYSALSEMNTIDQKIITIEDPVEYDIDGIIQIQTNSEVDLTFSSALRAILRQDPDTILIGEIRDPETADIAIQASLTGHIVFGTLHTNDSPSTVVRLRDMGVQDFLITSTIEAVLSQRLVRKICVSCKIEHELSQEELLVFPQLKGLKIYKGKGCRDCNDSGYKGRKGIFELMIMNDDIRELVSQKASADKIRVCAKKHGMKTLLDAGVSEVISGETTIEQVLNQATME